MQQKVAAARPLVRQAATAASGTSTGTVSTGTRKITTIDVLTKDKSFRIKQNVPRPAPKILARVEQLRLLSKLEQVGGERVR